MRGSGVARYLYCSATRTLVRKREVLSNFRFRTRVRVALQYAHLVVNISEKTDVAKILLGQSSAIHDPVQNVRTSDKDFQITENNDSDMVMCTRDPLPDSLYTINIIATNSHPHLGRKQGCNVSPLIGFEYPIGSESKSYRLSELLNPISTRICSRIP